VNQLVNFRDCPYLLDPSKIGQYCHFCVFIQLTLTKVMGVCQISHVATALPPVKTILRSGLTIRSGTPSSVGEYGQPSRLNIPEHHMPPTQGQRKFIDMNCRQACAEGGLFFLRRERLYLQLLLPSPNILMHSGAFATDCPHH